MPTNLLCLLGFHKWGLTEYKYPIKEAPGFEVVIVYLECERCHKREFSAEVAK